MLGNQSRQNISLASAALLKCFLSWVLLEASVDLSWGGGESGLGNAGWLVQSAVALWLANIFLDDHSPGWVLFHLDLHAEFLLLSCVLLGFLFPYSLSAYFSTFHKFSFEFFEFIFFFPPSVKIHILILNGFFLSTERAQLSSDICKPICLKCHPCPLSLVFPPPPVFSLSHHPLLAITLLLL